MDLCKFKTSLVYIASSWPARATLPRSSLTLHTKSVTELLTLVLVSSGGDMLIPGALLNRIVSLAD